MNAMVIAAALLERLPHLIPRENPGSELIAIVNSKLLPVLARLQCIIKNTDANHDTLREQAKAIMKVSYDLEDVVESYALDVASGRNGFLSWTFKRTGQQLKVMKKLEEVCKQIQQLPCTSDTSPKNQTLGIVESGHARQFSAPALVEDTEEIIGMEDQRALLTHVLTAGSSELALVSICGMPGIGKSTLARKLYLSPEIAYTFSICIWICVFQECKTRDILLQILSSISERWTNRSETMDMPQIELAEQVYKSLKGRKYLIVLDDVWDGDLWSKLRMAFPDDRNGSRILMTTRIRKEELKLGTPKSYIHEMRLLREEESWELLRRRAGLNDPKMEQIGQEIARQGDGLPLAMIALASILRGKPSDEWNRVLQQLPSRTPESSVQPLDVINISYAQLPVRLRPCLLYLGNLPQDAAIEMETICQLWMAEGLISMGDKRNGETVMDVAARYLYELGNRSLIQISDQVSGQRRSKSFRIHDQIQDFCKMKGKEDEFFKVGDENSSTTSAVRCTLYLDRHECSDADLPGEADYLRSLLFFTSSPPVEGYITPQEIPNLDKFIWLRVLYLYGVDFKDGKSPKGIEKLVYLRFLCFRECFLVELSSSVGKMLYLQTLDLRVRKECKMTIPNVLGNLKRLRFLYLPLAFRCPNHDEKLNLGELNEMEILENFDTNVCDAKDISNLNNLMGLSVRIEGNAKVLEEILSYLDDTSRNLGRASVDIGNFDCYTEERISVMKKLFGCRNLQAVGVEGHLGNIPSLFKNSSKLTEIVLNSSELKDDPMPILQERPQLKILVLEMEAYVGNKLTCSSSGFPELRYLRLSKLYKLEEWEVKYNSMTNLRSLAIQNCRKLPKLPKGLEFVTILQKLEIASMSQEFVGSIQKPDGTKGAEFDKIKHLEHNVKIDGKPLILRKQRQARPVEDPQSSSMFQFSRRSAAIFSNEAY